jgi:hypothetical protein
VCAGNGSAANLGFYIPQEKLKNPATIIVQPQV